MRSHKKRYLDKSDLPAWKRGFKWLFLFISVLLLAKLFLRGPDPAATVTFVFAERPFEFKGALQQHLPIWK